MLVGIAVEEDVSRGRSSERHHTVKRIDWRRGAPRRRGKDARAWVSMWVVLPAIQQELWAVRRRASPRCRDPQSTPDPRELVQMEEVVAGIQADQVLERLLAAFTMHPHAPAFRRPQGTNQL